MDTLYERCGLKCPSCGGTALAHNPDAVTCSACHRSMPLIDGVLCFNEQDAGDEVARLYSAMDGTHFVDVSFESNPLIYLSTRTYRRFADDTFPHAAGTLLDLGCGDGRMSLWAAERGFGPVVAVDSNLASLRRLTAEALKRGLGQIVAVCADLKQPPFEEQSFDAVICIEVLYYLVDSLGRKQAIAVAADLLKPGGTLLISEFSRYGRAIIDLDAMNLANARSLVEKSHRSEKFADLHAELFQWDVETLRSDLQDADLAVVKESGVSLAAALFTYAWTFTSYPLRPPLTPELCSMLESVCDHTSAATDATRNVIFAARKRSD